jgi:hypothetical protein
VLGSFGGNYFVDFCVDAGGTALIGFFSTAGGHGISSYGGPSPPLGATQ